MKSIGVLISKLKGEWKENVRSFVKEQSTEKEVNNLIETLIEIADTLIQKGQTTNNHALLTALGIKPSSEVTRRKRRKKTEEEERIFHRLRKNYHAKRLRQLEKRRKKRAEKQGQALATMDSDNETNMTREENNTTDFDSELSTEEQQAIDEECAQLDAALLLNAGDGSAFAPPACEVICRPSFDLKQGIAVLPVEPELVPEGCRRAVVKSNRSDLVITVTQLSCEREVFTDPITGQHTAANIELVGPKNSRFTWNAIVNVLLLVGGTALPMHRLEKLLSGTAFRRPNMVKMMDDFAWAFLPIYFHMTKILANADSLAGDDTGTRVNEVTSWQTQVEAELMRNPESPTVVNKPWEEREQKKATKNIACLTTILNEVLGFESPLSSKAKVGKARLQTTVLTGLEDPFNPVSRVVIYRTHFGSVGNLIDKILPMRNIKDHPHLLLQGDLSRANIPKNLPVDLTLSLAGCSAHARRFYKRHFTQDPELCEAMLSCFSMIYDCETYLDEAGRNSANVLAVRQQIAKKYWEDALNLAQGELEIWSKHTPIGKALRYLIKGYDKLTLYLNHPLLPPDNNLCENLLRYESLEDNSSFGRDTLEGRARFDLIRSAIASCSTAKVPERTYLAMVLMAKPEAVTKSPQYYTPHAMRTWLALPQGNVSSLDSEKRIAWETTQLAVKNLSFLSS